MRIKLIVFGALLALVGGTVFGQINAKLMRYPDVSAEQIAFVYGGDIWIMPRDGGNAVQLTRSPGEESWPRFSPDGKWLAFSAAYNGNTDVYVMPVTGGVPTRVTWQSHADRVVDWHPDGKHILFASSRHAGVRGVQHFFLVSRKGGFARQLDVPYGVMGSFSPDGRHLAYITRITENYPFKRYRGGLASDIILFDLQKNRAERITDNPATDGKPVWLGDHIYFLSDRDAQMRLNVWAYDVKTRKTAQVTRFSDFDVTYLSGGAGMLVLEAGGRLYLLNPESGKIGEVAVKVVSDLAAEMPRQEDVSKQIANMALAPGAKRVIFEARGELYNLPAKDGYAINLTRSSGAFDQQPAWSPDGKTVAYWSDRSGEYEIHLQPAMGGEDRQLTRRGKGFGYTLAWSPDGKTLAFINEKNEICVADARSGEIKVAGQTRWHITHPGRYYYKISWSPDSRWIAFTERLENTHSAIFAYNLESAKKHQLTSGFYEDFGPEFSQDGKYLFFLTDREMNAAYSAMGDGTWIYPNATRIAAAALAPDAPSLLPVKNDALDAEEKPQNPPKKENGKKEQQSLRVTVDPRGFESRLELLPPKAGNIRGLAAFKGQLVYLRYPNTGTGDRDATLMIYDLQEREDQPVIAPVEDVAVSPDRKFLLVQSQRRFGIIKPAPKQKIKDAVPTSGMVMDLVPRQEWRQIFTDTWRRYRDFFYDPNMHGLDWDAMRKRYGALIGAARTRWDVTNICSQLQAELSAGHTYTFGGDVQRVKPVDTGYLGVDWELKGKEFSIKRIVRPAAWDTDERSPLDRPGVNVKAGDTILAVNGVDLDPAKDPYAVFEGLAGKTVALKVKSPGDQEKPRLVVVKCLTRREEMNLRHLEWIEHNRKQVDRLSGGKLGYVYMTNTARQGQLELVRMYYGQLDKQGFIIDERFNGGGQLADRFLELLQRPVVYNLAWRYGRDHSQPQKVNTGPKGMLINGWAGSGGDGLPWAFQELQAGPIVGEATMGILVGPATGHRLIDGGGITLPGGRLYDNDGHWFWEGEGVKPDFPVWDDPNLLIQGRDPQMEKVVEEVMKLVKKHPPRQTPAPPLEDRTAKGLNKKSK